MQSKLHQYQAYLSNSTVGDLNKLSIQDNKKQIKSPRRSPKVQDFRKANLQLSEKFGNSYSSLRNTVGPANLQSFTDFDRKYKVDSSLRETLNYKPTSFQNDDGKYGSIQAVKDRSITINEDTLHQKSNILHEDQTYNKFMQKIDKNARLLKQLKKLKEQKYNKDEKKQKNQRISKQFNSNEYNPEQKNQRTFLKKQNYQYYTPKVEKYNFNDKYGISNQSKINRKFTTDQLTQEKSRNIDKYKLGFDNKIKKTDDFQTSIDQIRQLRTNRLNKNKSSKETSKSPTSLTSKVHISDFSLGKALGQGKFGTVHTALHRKSHSIYAIKKVPKSLIKSHYMVDQFILQIRLQTFLNHDKILKLYGCFDDSQNIYLVLQYMEGGTLFSMLKKSSTLSENITSQKVKDVAQAIVYMHKNGIAHRDIKPENIVISNGVCKLCDFGWATICNQRRKTYCGTFDYAAPEILQGQQYDMSVDLWCLGVLAYELLVGKAPFYHLSRKETMKKIINVQTTNINYPETLSRNAVSFISSLIKRKPQERLKTEKLLTHPFLSTSN